MLGVGAWFYTLIIGKLRAIVNRDTLENAREISAVLALKAIDEADGFCCSFVFCYKGDSIARFSLNESQYRFPFLAFANNRIQLPMPEGGALGNFLRAFFYACSARGWFYNLRFTVLALSLSLYKQVLIRDANNETTIYICIEGAETNMSAKASIFAFYISESDRRAFSASDFVCDELDKSIVIAKFKGRSFKLRLVSSLVEYKRRLNS